MDWKMRKQILEANAHLRRSMSDEHIIALSEQLDAEEEQEKYGFEGDEPNNPIPGEELPF